MNGITEAQKAALTRLATALDSETYLAGGVAAGLALGHRISKDLYLFVPTDFDEDRLAEAANNPEASGPPP